MKDFGRWPGVDFQQEILGMSPASDADESNIEWAREGLITRGYYDSFREALTLLLVDNSMTIMEKGNFYLGGMESAGEAWDYFKWIWDNMFPGEPWPLEGQERPKD